MKKVPAAKARETFAARINTIGLAYGELIEIIHQHPAEFKQADVNKVTSFLTLKMQTLAEAMAIVVNNATPAEFSFDMEVPSVPQLPIISRAIQRADERATVAAEVRKTLAPKPDVPTRPKAVGRLVGTKEVVIEEVPLIPQRSAYVEESGEKPDPATGEIREAGFLTD